MTRGCDVWSMTVKDKVMLHRQEGKILRGDVWTVQGVMTIRTNQEFRKVYNISDLVADIKFTIQTVGWKLWGM
jgi:hypothetical protein